METLAAQERCDCWNIQNSDGDTPISVAVAWSKTEMVQILLRCPRVDLSHREGLSLVFKAIERNEAGEKITTIIYDKSH